MPTHILKIATWNINSLRLRMENVLRFLRQHRPTILCLQETKVEDAKFPFQPLKDATYPHLYFSGEKSYNGVAIVSQIPLKNVSQQSWVNNNKRHISAFLPNGIELHNFYVPAGGDIPDPTLNPKFNHKLRFVDGIAEWFKQQRSSNDNIILLGDLNIAPLEHDVWSHKQLLKVVSHTPVEVEKLNRMMHTLDWVDSARHFTSSAQKLYSWWSYRNRDWRKSNRGRRLDHIWVTPAMKPRLLSNTILKEFRDGDKPSDHVPVMTELAL